MILRNKKALSPVVSAIILIAVTVAVAIVATNWIGSMTFSFMSIEELQITNCQWAQDVSYADLTVNNIGTKSATISKVEINGVLANDVSIVSGSATLNVGETTTIRITQSFIPLTKYKFRIITQAGTGIHYIARSESVIPSASIHYVNATSNVDGSADKGTHSNFADQQVGPDSGFDVLTEEDTYLSTNMVTLIDQESFEGSWPPSSLTSWSETGNWNKTSNRAYQGSYSADFNGVSPGVSGNLDTCELDCSDAVSISVQFSFYDEGLDPSELFLYYFDGNGWVESDANLDTNTPNNWNIYQEQITDPRFFNSNFKIRWNANDVEDSEHAYIDLVTVTKEVNADNYELDIEIQFTDIDVGKNYEEISIFMGSATGEALDVYIWNGGSWDTLVTGLTPNQWNNATRTITEDIVTLRLLGNLETSDTTQDSWEIDCALLYAPP